MTQTLINTETVEVPLARTARTDRCAGQHFGAWAIYPKWFASAVNAIRSGQWKPGSGAHGGDTIINVSATARADGSEPAKADVWDDDEDGEKDSPGYTVCNGVAIICIDGQMTKRGSSWGGCSTVEVRSALRTTVKDYAVRAILLKICTPGGTVSGTSDLAADIRWANSIKPVYTYVEDMCCSAGYWAASQTRKIFAGVTAIVGCIGTYTVLEDDTGYQEQWGFKYRVVSTGEYKGLGADGKVTDLLVADVQREINELNAPFLADVALGRAEKLSANQAIWSDGRAHVGQQALTLGLIDAVSTLDDALAAIYEEIGTMAINSQQFTDYAAANPRAAEVEAIREEGRAEIRKEMTKPATAPELSAAFPGDSDFVVSQLTAGATLNAALSAGCKHLSEKIAKMTTDHAAALTVKDEAHAAIIKEKDATIAARTFEVTGVRPVNTIGAQAAVDKEKQAKKDAEAKDESEFAKIEDPKARAEAEWKADFGGCHEDYAEESAYVGYRMADLRGQIKQKKRQ